MDKFFKKIKLWLIIIFIIPAIGLIYFSSNYVYSNFKKYEKSMKLERSVKYSQVVMYLVQSLQKERGLSLACLEHNNFCSYLSKQRKITDKRLNEYYNYIIKNDRQGHKNIIENLQKIVLLRKDIDNKKITLLEVLEKYSAIIRKLLDSLNVMNQEFINEYIFKVILVFNKILELTEINGQERALVATVLQKENPERMITDRLLMLDAVERGLKKIIEENIPTDILILYRRIIPLEYESSFYNIKERIIHKREFSLLSKEEWWQKSTEYIDRLFKVDKELAKKLLELKSFFKEKALSAFYSSVGLWIISFVSLIFFIITFSYFLNAYEKRLRKIESEKELVEIFSDFSENILVVEDINSLLAVFSSLLSRIKDIAFHYILDCKHDKIIITDGISTTFIEAYEPKKLKQAIKEVKKSGKIKIVKLYDEDYKGVNTLFLFPIKDKQCLYLLVLGLNKDSILDTQLLDFISKVAELFLYVYRQIRLKEEDKKLREELRLLSYAFNAHEAITITDNLGNILRVNKAFETITGYKPEEVLGKNTSILKSGKHSKEFYQKMWDTIKHQGYWKGEIYNKRKDGTIYPEMLSITAIKGKDGKISNYIAHFFDITDMKRAQEEIKRQANYDILTDIPNRRYLIEELNIIRMAALKEGFCNAFFFIDLDDFKYINDSYGHATGDSVLVEIAKRIKKLQKEQDVVARIAGDEFALIAVDLAKDEKEAAKKAAIIAEKLVDLVKEPVKVDELELEVSFSIGIAIFPTTEKSAEEVITNADIAMYHSKKRGKNTFSFYNENLDLESKRFLIMKNEIKEGLKRSEFELHYQPKFTVGSLELAGFEALLRWNSTNYGFLYPDQFLRYAYGNQLIYDITTFVVDEVKNTISDWAKKGHFPTISLNLSAEQFNNRKYMQHLLEKFDGKWSKQVIIEVLEDALIQDDLDYTIDIIKKFAKRGVRFAIDDFGSGYSSLSYLRQLPVYELKIDKQFVINLFSDNNDKIVEMVVDIGHSFGFKVTAEGVESKKHMDYLHKCSCDFIQGFYMSRAVPKKEAEKFFDFKRK